MNTIQFLKAGTWVADNGERYTFDADALQSIADSYDKALHEAPVVIGHPKTDSPAYGWIGGIKANGDALEAELAGDVTADMQQWLADKHYKKVSPSLYAPNDLSNPTPGKWYLRHIGFLGAKPPAIKGLRQAEFSDDGGMTFSELADMTQQTELSFDSEISDMDKSELEKRQAALDAKMQALEEKERILKDKEASLLAKEQASVKASNADFLSSLKLTPAQAAGVATFMDVLGQVQADNRVAFAEPGETEIQERAPLEFFKSLLKKLVTPSPNFNELTPDLTDDGRRLDKDDKFLTMIVNDAENRQKRAQAGS